MPTLTPIIAKNVANETARIAKQQEDLGEEGMKEAALVVKEALASTQLPPKSVLLKVPFAYVNGITHRTLHYYNYTTAKHQKVSISNLSHSDSKLMTLIASS